MLKLVVAASFAVCLSVPALAEGPKPFPEFSAKRVKPPSKTASKRITIQIDTAQPAPEAVSSATPSVASAVPKQGYAWFWEGVSPDFAATGPGRLQSALQRINKPPAGKGVRAPRLQTLQDIARAQGIEILKSTVGTGVSPALVLAVISVESGGRVDAVSGAGAQGLMQLMPATAERFGVSDSMNASQNIKGGVQYLDWLLRKFDQDPILALAGYNAGENSISKHNGVPPYAETRDYVPKVLAAYQVASGLCKTPPELISDGCVFVSMR